MSRRQRAKFLFRVAGWLTHIKTPQRFYRVVSFDPFVTEPTKRRWVSCRLSTRLLKRSMHLDWDHWDHWALLHEDCGGTLCPECGGIDCFKEMV